MVLNLLSGFRTLRRQREPEGREQLGDVAGVGANREADHDPINHQPGHGDVEGG